MVDAAPVVHFGENSAEEVAFKLMFNVAVAEGKQFTRAADIQYISSGNVDRKWILDTYAECLRAVTHPHVRLPKS